MIELKDAVDALDRAVALKGEQYVYPGSQLDIVTCDYSDRNGAPSCIVGHVLAELEPDAYAEIVKWETLNGESFMVEQMHSVLGRQILSNDARRVLFDAQAAQDMGTPWGEAVAVAKRVFV